MDALFGLLILALFVGIPLWLAVRAIRRFRAKRDRGANIAPSLAPAAHERHRGNLPGTPQHEEPAQWRHGQIPPGPVLGLEYVDLHGSFTCRVVTILEVTLDEVSSTGLPHAIEAFCHERMEGRTFLLTGMRRAVFPDGETLIDQEQIGFRLMLEMGAHPFCTIPEQRPGTTRSRRHPRPPLEVVLQWERTPGDVETFDMAIEDVELASGVAFAFSGTARRRKSATDRAYRAEKRFKLRGWDTPDAPIRAMFTRDGEPIARPHLWLAEMTSRRRPANQN